jgi:hypothetical protein
MRRTTFLCQPCNRTWAYSLSPEMTDSYAAAAPKLTIDDIELVATPQSGSV